MSDELKKIADEARLANEIKLYGDTEYTRMRAIFGYSSGPLFPKPNFKTVSFWLLFPFTLPYTIFYYTFLALIKSFSWFIQFVFYKWAIYLYKYFIKPAYKKLKKDKS